MRARVKKIRSGERVNYLASVSDLMSGLLFVFILALTVAIIQTKHSAQEAKEAAMQMESIQARLKNVEARLIGTREATGNLLDRLQKELVKENVMQSYRQVLLPAMVSGCSVRVARGPLTVIACPPRLY